MTRLSRRGEIRLGFRCNARCGFCYYQGLLDQPMELEPTIESLRDALLALRRLGATEVEFTGGEPTIRPELPELARYARKLGFRNVSLITNGIRMARRDYTAALADAGVNDVLFSIHGADAASHDAHTGVPGSHTKVLQAFAHACDLGMRCRVTCTVTGRNVGDVDAILEAFLRLQARCIHFAVFSPVARADGTDIGLSVSYADAAAALKHAIGPREGDLPPLSIKYIPFCYMQGYEHYVMNLYQQSFDPDDWNYYFSNRVRRAPAGWRGLLFDTVALLGCLLARHPRLPFGHGLLGMKVYGFTRLVELLRKRRAPACRRCSHDAICDHVWRGYSASEDLKPIPGPRQLEPATNYRMAYSRSCGAPLPPKAPRRIRLRDLTADD